MVGLVIVYATGYPRGHFHTTPTCDRLRAGQAGRKSTRQVVGLTPDQLERRTPCRRCYPDAPRVKVWMPYCSTCETARPCPHNGGVEARIPCTYVDGYALLEPGETIHKVSYVRPERAHLYSGT